MNRKTFVTKLGAMGLGLGAVVAPVGGAPAAQAQEGETSDVNQDPAAPFAERLDQRKELYADFTAALAKELGIGNADEVDAAIRIAIIAVIDQREADGLLTYGQAEALKTLVATSDVPLAPGFMVGAPHGDVIMSRFGPGGPDRGSHMFPGQGDERGSFIERIREERESRVDEPGQDDSPQDDNEDAT